MKWTLLSMNEAMARTSFSLHYLYADYLILVAKRCTSLI